MTESPPPDDPETTALVTGCSSGIGFETVRAFAERGFRVIVHGRNEAKAAEAVRALQALVPGARLEPTAFDLEDLRAVERAAQDLRARLSRLDVLFNNAGAVYRTRTLTRDGLEAHFGVNYLAGHLLTNRLVPLLQASGGGRVVNVSSVTHRIGRIRFDDLQCENGFHWLKAYGRSKLAVLCGTYALARRLAGGPVTVNAVDPGIVSTNIFLKDGTASKRLLGPLMDAVILSPAEAAATGLYVATSGELEGVTGRYFVKGRARASSKASRDEATGERLWEDSERLLKEHL